MVDGSGMRMLALDIETAPLTAYAWGLFKETIHIDRVISSGYTLCWAAQWEGEDEVMFRSLFDSSAEDMLSDMWALLDEADVVIHYNGKKFDMPTLNGEFAKHGMTPPSNYRQIDLYHIVRSTFRFASNKLDFVARELGIGSKVQHKGMELWTDCMTAIRYDWGDYVPAQLWESWEMMQAYNEEDVRLLWRLYERLQPWIRSHPNRALWVADLSEPMCPNCGSKNVRKRGIERPSTTYAYQRYKCNDCGANSRGRTSIKELPKPEIV